MRLRFPAADVRSGFIARGAYAAVVTATLVLLCSGPTRAAEIAPNTEAAATAIQESRDAGDSGLLSYGEDDIWDENGQLIAHKDTKTTRADEVAETPDPLEGWNRAWFTFNDRLYFWAVKPIAEGYSDVVPVRPRLWVRNFFHNLMYPVRFVNLMLQAKFAAAAVETSRFIGNTAFGLGGLGDVTGDCKPFRPIPSTDQDFGLTLGYWGVKNGFYIVWPFIGPSTGRDTVGYAGDYFLSADSYLHPWYWSIASKVYDRVNTVSLHLGDYEAVKEASLDPYEAIRDAYLRMRFKKMTD